MEQMRERVARQYIPMRCDNIPVSCVDFAVVDTLTGKEVCRVWSEDDCRMLADLLNAPPISDAALAPMRPEIDRRVAEEKARLLERFDEDELEQIISDSLDMDWRPRDAARAIQQAMLAQYEKEQQP